MTTYWAERTLDGEGLAVTVDGDTIAIVQPVDDPPSGAIVLPGLTVPGLVNSHSHAFHRLLRGRTQEGRGDFWSWRQEMFTAAERLNPDTYLKLATAVFTEMALTGITAVAEFHYLHHRPGGARYQDHNAMGHALIEAARVTGVRLSLLDTVYLRATVSGEALTGPQLMFGDGDFESWASRVGDLDDGPGSIMGAAVHSVRAVPEAVITATAEWCEELGRPLHVHVSEQPQENRDCLDFYGRTPTRLLADCGALGPRVTAVHATHVSDDDIEALGSSRTNVCFCPTTERDLGDGVGPADALIRAGATLTLGSDSHAVIDLFEEARAVELNQRLVAQQRGLISPNRLAQALWSSESLGLGSPQGIVAGARADLTSVATGSVRTAGTLAPGSTAGLVFAATGADVTHVVSQGRLIVSDGHHTTVDEPARLLVEVADEVWR